MNKPTSGASPEGIHVYPVRVYYEDTDAAGIVYYANYLKYAERARTEMLRDLGTENARLMETEGLAFAVRRCEVDFFKPARLDDLLSVETRLIDVDGASLVADQRVKQDNAELVRMELKLACMSLDGRPARLPAAVKSRLEEFRGNVHSKKQ
ncbi:MAG: tol-pal system-associated acyl-CoA thioesterase [Rhodospirillaceae bacterium]|jgi:acyl-CoA thioester hydrolase|nr:tol-pal system-associated acyl-CoA thioesterase [Rhodospirillaceae bacterium]|tara:strand:+ start:1226 stop:1681 length:456 start_codon:yes stop_codon:yes gene_type:complete